MAVQGWIDSTGNVSVNVRRPRALCRRPQPARKRNRDAHIIKWSKYYSLVHVGYLMLLTKNQI